MTTKRMPRPTGFLVVALLALASAAAAMAFLPHNREVGSLGEFMVKLVPFIFAVEAIARFEPAWLGRFRIATVLIPVCFLAYFAYFVPKNFYWGGVRAEDPEAFPSLYYNILLLTPVIILSLVLAYRLGGGRPSVVRRLGIGMLLIMISGIEDLAFLTVNDLSGTPFSPIPDVWTWPSHIKVRIGHWPTKTEAFAFIAVHLTLAALVLWAPDSWFAKVAGRFGSRADARGGRALGEQPGRGGA